jgi:uncharacterized surface protein with fasciclin (FAS1) repeats
MKLSYSILSLLFIVSVLSACKQDVKNEKEIAPVEEVVAEVPERKEPSKESIAQSNSVMARVMSTKESKAFASYMITAEVSDQLLKEEGPFTVFAPSDEALKSMDEELIKSLPMAENKPLLVSMVKSHIVEGSHDSVTLIQALKKGKVSLKSISGESLTVTRKGSDILVTDSKGNVSTVGKSDIQASNGVVHVVNAVLGLN